MSCWQGNLMAQALNGQPPLTSMSVLVGRAKAQITNSFRMWHKAFNYLFKSHFCINSRRRCDQNIDSNRSSVLQALWATSCPIIKPLHGLQLLYGTCLPRQNHTYRGQNHLVARPITSWRPRHSTNLWRSFPGVTYPWPIQGCMLFQQAKTAAASCRRHQLAAQNQIQPSSCGFVLKGKQNIKCQH